MASSSFNVPRRKYQVFLSFRGKDTRRNIVSFLLKALKDKQIEVFSDYKLKEGNEISPALLRAIEESYISLVIFSKGYANSKWCLEELEKIIDCMESYKQIVVPIFYDVDPSTVRHQKDHYMKAFRRQEEKFKHDTDKIQSWRTSLKKAANLSGLDFSKLENDADIVKQIVKCVWEKLKNIVPPNDSTGLIGIDKQIEELELLLCQRQQDVFIIGIWGMGGIGKSTIASLLFQKLSHEYECCHFLENVGEELRKCSIAQLKNKLISKLLEEDLGITIPYGLPPHIKWRLQQKKVLVVLDDVDDSEQLNDLTGAYDWFGQGSTIITTSRDKSVLSKYCSKIYEVKTLSRGQSLQLFSLQAFKEGCLKMEGHHELSLRVIDYVKGNPLALKVLGCFLYGKTKAEWRSELTKLEKMPFPKIQSVLKLSYDALDRSEKDIFLYIACFFKGFSKGQIISLLDNSLQPAIGLRTLEDKALITTSYGDLVTMHDLTQEMGRQIVREESPKDPSEWPHLWDHNDIYKVLKNHSGTKYIKSISLQCWRIKNIHLGRKAFQGMINLKYLNFQCQSGLHISRKSFHSLQKNLKFFYCGWYPLKAFPSICLKNLVQLLMPHCKVKTLWNGIQDLGSLKKIDLSRCDLLEELPDMSKASRLEIVDLTGCSRLRCVHPSILSNHNLVQLHLTDCQSLRTLKSQVHLRSLEHIGAGRCQNLKEFSMSSEQLKVLFLYETGIENFPSLITIGLLNSLTDLSLDRVKLVSLPASIKHLSNLEELHLRGCSRLRSLPELPPSIKFLYARNCISLEAVFTSNSSRSGSHLNPRYPFEVDFHGCKKLGEDTVNAIVTDFVVITAGTVHQLPTPSVYPPGIDGSWAVLPLSKVPNVLNFQTSQGCESEIGIEVPPNSDLMAIIFCFAISRLRGLCNLRCRCFVHVNNGERKEYNQIFHFRNIDGDHVVLRYQEYFNHSIMNGIKESRALSSSTDEYTKVSFEIYDIHPCITQIGVCPIYASELHSCFSTNIKRSRDTAHPLLMIKKKKRKLALQKGMSSLKLSKQLLPHS